MASGTGWGAGFWLYCDTKDPLSPGLHPSYREQLINWEERGWRPQATILNLRTGSILVFSSVIFLQMRDIELAC